MSSFSVSLLYCHCLLLAASAATVFRSLFFLFLVGMTCCGPDVAHVPKQKSARSGGRVYFLYKAAEDGCLACVKHLVDTEGVDPKQVSASCGYSALDFAAWAKSSSSDPGKYDDVLAYLRESTSLICKEDLSPAASVDLSPAASVDVLPFSCGGPDVAHVPPKRGGKAQPRGYYLYKAAEHGCLQCVRYLVEIEGLDPNERSSTNSYSAADFARWVRDPNQGSEGYDKVIAYLEELVPSGEQEPPTTVAGSAQRWRRVKRSLEKSNRQVGLDTPVPGGKGARIMEKMGWQPGERLGTQRLVQFVSSAGSYACLSDCPVACGLLEPLRPVEPREDRRGLGFAEVYCA